MMFELDRTLKTSEPDPPAGNEPQSNAATTLISKLIDLEPAPKPDEKPHGTVESCPFEELLERAMEIVRARRAGAGGTS